MRVSATPLIEIGYVGCFSEQTWNISGNLLLGFAYTRLPRRLLKSLLPSERCYL